MPASYGSRPWSLNPLYWIGWVIAAGVAFALAGTPVPLASHQHRFGF